MLEIEQQVEVQRVLRLRSTNRSALRDLTKNWTVAHYEYMEQRAPADVGRDVIGMESLEILREFSRYTAEEERHKQTIDADERRHRESLKEIGSKLDALRKPHWTATPTFFVAIAAAVIALFAWLFPRR